jgi:hypothetical protein
MSERTARKLVEFSLIGTMMLGGIVAAFGFTWLPAFQAASVDGILNQEELLDPKLIAVVYRTHRHIEGQAILVWPYPVLGSMIVGCALAGLVGLRRWNPYLWTSDPGPMKGG